LKKSFFIGPVNRNSHPNGGDQFKNRILFDILKGIIKEIVLIDTSTIYGRLKLLWLFIFEKTGQIDKLVISASTISSYNLIKLLNEKTRWQTTYFVMGGALPGIIKSNNFKPCIYNGLKNVLVQGETIRAELLNFGISSKVLHNFKHRVYGYKLKPNFQNINKLHLVFVSRVTEDKGVFNILEALNDLSNEHISCTFFGPCDEDMKEAILKNKYSLYGGYLNFYSKPEESYCKLAEFDAMVFPTKWHGEGFPGVFLDAFMVGLPVICSDWNMNSEVIQDGYNGIVLKENNAECLAKAINKINTGREWLFELSKNSMASFDQYDFETAKVRIEEILS
jgi:glycosyltransferase involved in cell wall biosynthesis